jgi:ubiquinone/menaquinone biosynthesis C-methylase UbiE
MKPMHKPVTILDIGGTSTFWERMGLTGDEDVRITVLNLYQEKNEFDNMKSVVGDGRDLKDFKNKEFDIVFSNSVIEHLGNYGDQKRMAREIERVGKNYFVQTPSCYTPVEPHFFFPLFQFLPDHMKILLVSNFNLGYFKKTKNKNKAKDIVRSIRLLRKKEVKQLFPGSQIHSEKFLGFTISYLRVPSS